MQPAIALSLFAGQRIMAWHWSYHAPECIFLARKTQRKCVLARAKFWKWEKKKGLRAQAAKTMQGNSKDQIYCNSTVFWELLRSCTEEWLFCDTDSAVALDYCPVSALCKRIHNVLESDSLLQWVVLAARATGLDMHYHMYCVSKIRLWPFTSGCLSKDVPAT